jgi:hypothetical protein
MWGLHCEKRVGWVAWRRVESVVMLKSVSEFELVLGPELELELEVGL